MGKKARLKFFRFLDKLGDILNVILTARDLAIIVKKKVTQPEVIKKADELEAAVNKVLN